MTAKPECCGGCLHFTNEDALGLGWCALKECEATCGSGCKEYENKKLTMKARIKKTGEVVKIADYAKVTLDQCDSWGNPIELGFDEVEILQEPTSDIDWEQRRYEIAKDTMQGILYGLMTQEDIEISCHNVAKSAIMLADAFITEFKKGGQK